jgi:hypothetical protein
MYFEKVIRKSLRKEQDPDPYQIITDPQHWAKIYLRHPHRALVPEFFYSDISSLAGSGFTIR